MCKLGALYRIAKELNADVVILQPGGFVVVAHFDRFRADEEIAIDLISSFPWQVSETWAVSNGFCDGN